MEDGGRLRVEKKFGGVLRQNMSSEESRVASTVLTGLVSERQQLADTPDLETDIHARTYSQLNEHLGAISDTLKLTPAEMDLYRRRYSMVDVEINTEGSYAEFQQSIQVPDVTEAQDGQQPELSRMDRKKQQKQKEKAAKSSYERAKEGVTTRFADPDQLNTEWFNKNVLQKKIELKKQDGSKQDTTQSALMEAVMAGNYENLEQLDPVLRNMAAKSYLERITFTHLADTQPSELVNALFNQGGVAALMNPLFRVGLSLLAQGATVSRGIFASCTPADCAEMEDLCNQRIMSSTLYTVPKQSEGFTPEELERNKQSQIFIAKTLLASHMGQMQRVTTDEDTEEKTKRGWKHGMATAFAHCSRVAFTLPGDKKTTDAMCGDEHGLKAGFFKRTAATHKLSKKKKSKEGSELIEKKSKLGTFYGQQGMNVAVGGLGNPGVGGPDGVLRKLKNDGSCGHVYMHVDQGGESAYTGLLIGFESDAPGVMNMTGHRHGMGNPEFASSFGGMRTDEIGDKYGGRVVDLSDCSAEKFEMSMQLLEQKMNDLYAKVSQGDEAAQAELMNLSDMLAGKQLTQEQINEILGEVKYNGKTYKTVESYALARKVEQATPEELKDPKMIAAIQQDFIENFGALLKEAKDRDPDAPLDPFALFRGDSIGTLKTFNLFLKKSIPAGFLTKAIESVGPDAMKEIGEYFRRSELQSELLDYAAHKIRETPDIKHELEQQAALDFVTRPASLDQVFKIIGDQIRDGEVGGLLSGISKAFTDHGVSDIEFSKFMMNNLMLRSAGIVETMASLKVMDFGRWTEGLTPEQEKDLYRYNAMKMMQQEANDLLHLDAAALLRNPFTSAIRERMKADAAAQQPTN